MPARLILNADDFGLTPGINTAIAELHTAGALTSATLLATGPAFHHAVNLAQQYPTLGIGCHIVLTDGTPILPPDEIPTLLDPKTSDKPTFRPILNDFLRAAILRRIHPDEVRREAIAQIQTLQHAGIRVTHLDTHKHTHILPQITRALLAAAEATGVPAIRNPFESRWSLRLGHTRPSRALSVTLTRLFRRRFFHHPAIRSGRVLTTQGTIGISATGQLDEPLLRQLLAVLPDGADTTWELVCHPGYNDPDLDRIATRLRETRDIERQALLAVFGKASSQQVGEPASQRVSSASNSSRPPEHPSLPRLIHYGDLTA